MDNNMNKLDFTGSNFNQIKKLISVNLEYNRKYCFNFLNAYSVYLFKKNDVFNKSLSIVENNNYNFIDSAYIALVLRLKFFKNIMRLQGPNFTEQFLSNKELTTDQKIFFIGFENKDLDFISRKYFLNRENLFTYNPPYIKGIRFAEAERKKIITLINKSKSSYLFIGVGNPKQEILGNDILSQICVSGIFNVGAAFDFITNKKKRAPVFFQKIGLEWLYRLITNYKYIHKRIIPTFKGVLFAFSSARYKLIKTK